MKKTKISIVTVFVLSIIGSAVAQTGKIDCESTRRAWAADTSLPARYKNCTCERSDALPVCSGDDSSDSTYIEPNPARPKPIDVGFNRRLLLDSYRKAEAERYASITARVSRMMKPWTSPVAFVDPYRMSTERRIRELNCSATFAVRALRLVEKADTTIDGVLDRDLEVAAAMLQKAFGAAEGLSVAECPPVSIAPLSDAVAAENEPQARFYRRSIEDAIALIQIVSETKTATLVTTRADNQTKDQLDDNRARLERIKNEPPGEAKRDGLRKIEEEYSDLARRAAELRKRAEELAAATAQQEKRIGELEERVRAVSADGSRAGEFL